jgi:hypothetical protein
MATSKPKRPSPTELGKRFIAAAQGGDVTEVRRLIQESGVDKDYIFEPESDDNSRKREFQLVQ